MDTAQSVFENRINQNTKSMRALRLVYKDNISSFEELLIRDKTFLDSFTIHEQNIHTLAVEIYKVVNHLIFLIKEYDTQTKIFS